MVFWNGNDCSSMETEKGGQLYRARPPPGGILTDAARLRRLLTCYADAGFILGPGQAATWQMSREVSNYVDMLRTGHMPPDFLWRDGPRFWFSVKTVRTYGIQMPQTPLRPEKWRGVSSTWWTHR